MDKSASQPVSGLHKTFFRLPLGRGAVANWAAAEETVECTIVYCAFTVYRYRYRYSGTPCTGTI